MTSVVTRIDKGSPLTWSELDDNFLNIANTSSLAYAQANSAFNEANTKLSSSGGVVSGDVSILGTTNTHTLIVNNNSISSNTIILIYPNGEQLIDSFSSLTEVGTKYLIRTTNINNKTRIGTGQILVSDLGERLLPEIPIINQLQELLLYHDFTDVSVIEYGSSGNNIINFTANLVGNTVYVYGTPITESLSIKFTKINL